MDEVASPSTAAEVPTPAVFAAALSGDPDAIINTSTPSGCMAATTCPNPKSCGSWSTAFECAETCSKTPCQGGTEGLLGRAFLNKFRDCTLLDGTACREWALTFTGLCGC
jgi:hypothetical protein